VLTRLQFYIPWDLLPEQKDRIQQQIEDAQASIDLEVDDFERRRVEGDTHATTIVAPDALMEDNGIEDKKTVGSEESASHREVAGSHAHEDGDTDLAPTTMTTNGTAEKKHGAPTSSDLAKEVAEEDQGETVVEAAEDTIIY
jgi:hypothetical protein